MSIIFGVRRSAEQFVHDADLRKLAHATSSHAPDGLFVHTKGNIGMGFQPYHTHERSMLEKQPVVDAQGNFMTLDGRIDNHAELAHLLQLSPTSNSDSQIILAGFERWGENCFSRLVGDWALALWCETTHALYLVRDHAGTRTLYYEVRKDGILWGTYLETFFADGEKRELDRAYAACYLACQPIRDLTPYKGIYAITPAHYVRVQMNQLIRKPHWSWMATSRIHYHKETEYEEHFLSLFKQAVERRTGAGAPILAQLSGGMDSSSIVCISDHIRRQQGGGSEDFLNSVSYYDDSEPNWNEKPYFEAVEERRGKTGIHLAVCSTQSAYELPDVPTEVCLLPGINRETFERAKDFESAIAGKGFRVILSGIGGDEVLGGVPNPLPELADYFVAMRLAKLLHQSVRWCLPDRFPLALRLREVMAFVVRTYWPSRLKREQLPPWLEAPFVDACSAQHAKDFTRQPGFKNLPSTIARGHVWWSILESLPTSASQLFTRHEFRFPYLDKDLINYLFAVPPEYLLRPGRRRFLMRRALEGIVPTVVLQRPRKAFITRRPLALLQQSREAIVQDLPRSAAVQIHAVQSGLLRDALELLPKGDHLKWATSITRTIAFNLWMKSAATLVS